MQQPVGQMWNEGAPISNGGAGTTGPPAGDGPDPEPSGPANHAEVEDWTLKDNMVNDLIFFAILASRRMGHNPFMQTWAETSDTSAEVVEPDPRCSWQGHSSGVGRDESTGSRSVVQSFRIPSVIRPERRTFVIVVRWTDELLCGRYQWVSQFEMPCVPTRWTGERWVEQMSRLHGTVC